MGSLNIWHLFQNILVGTGLWNFHWTQLVMIGICFTLLYLAIAKGFEPLLLIPIGFGGLFANIPLGGFLDEGGFLWHIYNFGIGSGVFPLLIFIGLGAMTDFGPLIANPRLALMGWAAQLGIFTTLIGAIMLPGFDFTLAQAASIGIIGSSDGPTAIYVTTKLAPELLGAVAVAAYSYMALVPIIQPPIMYWLTTPKERKIKMTQLRKVSQLEKIIFPLIALMICALFAPAAAPLIGAFTFGNLLNECGKAVRLAETAKNEFINIVTILLGLAVGSRLQAEQFLQIQTIAIVLLGLSAFAIGTASGVLMAKFMNLYSKNKINPLIGSSGVSAMPMAARVSNKLGLEADPQNFLIMHAMGPNVASVIGSAVVAGIFLAVFQ